MKISLKWRGIKKSSKRILSKIKNKIYINKIITGSLVIRLMTISILFSTIPAEAVNVENKDNIGQYDSKITLDLNKSIPVKVDSAKEIKIIPGESEYNKKLRQEAAKKTRATANVIARERSNPRPDVSLEQKRALAKSAAASTGIDWKILEAVWQVETGKSWDTSVHSYAGAQGPMQFMPSTFRKYATDGNGDGKIEISNAQDAVYSAAKLLACAGAADGKIDQALLSYNHAQWYVNKVKKVADSINE